MLALEFYDCVVAVHVMAIVIAFGVTFAYPVMTGYLQRNAQQHLVPFHELQGRIGKFFITPAAVLALLTGIYLASDHDLFSKSWVQVPMGVLIALLITGGAYFGPTEDKLAELAQSDPGGAAYKAKFAQFRMVLTVAQVAILVAVFFMVVKPGGY